VGIRDIDDFERETIDRHGIKHWDVQQVVDWMRANRNLPIHISFDIDVLDPQYISSTGTRVDDGMHPHEVREIIVDALCDDQLKSLDVVEFNPELGDPLQSAHHVREVFRDFFPNEFP
jgi:arginase